MLPTMAKLASTALSLLALSSIASSHIVITYPGWRGDNLNQNGSVVDSTGLGIGPNNTYPYGMQWIYPCGGMSMTTNRTAWPVTGGTIAFQPGWFPGHQTAIVYINLGIDTNPANYSFPMLPPVELLGPSKDPYPGGVCFPQVPLPANYYPKIGDNATIQVVETAVHGAALYSCVDITFVAPEDAPVVNGSNCVNSTNIGFASIFFTSSLSGAESIISRPSSLVLAIPLLTTLFWGLTSL